MNQVYPTKCMFSERKNVMDIDSIKVKGYKSFSEKYIEVDLKSNITVFIGRNNSGKSSCLDIIEGLTNASKFNELNVDNTLDYQVSCKLLEYIKKINKNFESQKVLFSKKVCRYITKNNSEHILDLKKQIEALYKYIQEWNK